MTGCVRGALLSGGILVVIVGAGAAAQVPPPTEGAPSTPALQRLLEGRGEVVGVADGFTFTEGPVWHADGYLLFTDIPRDRILRWHPRGGVSVLREPSGRASGLACDASGRLLAAEHEGRRISRTESDERVVTLVDRFGGKRLNSPNDLIVARDGSVYFTDPPYGLPGQSSGKELDFNGLFRVASDGRTTVLARDLGRPNGLAFSPDQKRLYVTDSERGHVRVYAVAGDGTLDAGRVLTEVRPWRPGMQGVPDGLKVDVQGRLYVAGPGGIWILDPSGGRLGVIATPETPSNCTFGDADRKTLYITARTRIYKVRLTVAGAH
jgi:YD repeat-containing protein